MKPTEVTHYSKAIASWDKKHRIVGKTPPQELIGESLEAIEAFKKVSDLKTLLDVGAGSGLLGIPWLYQDPGHKAVFIEPDVKKVAFLHLYLSGVKEFKGRYLVLSQRVERVSRETIDAIAGADFFLVARAFSGDLEFSEAIELSAFRDASIYVFSPTAAGHRFLKWSKPESTGG